MARKDGSGRPLHERVKSRRGRKAGSTRWLERQLNDPYVHEAHRRGYRSRAAFKLIQIDDRFGFLRPGQRVVDLGAAPGGWTQVAVERVRPDSTGGVVVGLDKVAMEPIAGATLIEADILADGAVERLRGVLGGPADVVLSDMAAPSTGHAATDHLRTLALAEAAVAFAGEALAPGGTVLVKVLQGADEPKLFAALRRRYESVRRIKPRASRGASAELYLLAMGRRGAGSG
ncbi:MAG: RlmE family RNA methyltransferase [Alphaproteobacteria bacterium]